MAYLIPVITKLHHLKEQENSLISAKESISGGVDTPSRRMLSSATGILPLCVVLVPSRDLARSVYVEAVSLCHGSNIRVVSICGGSDIKNQLFELSFGVDILVTTNNKLLDLIEKKILSISLCGVLVIDEVDYLLRSGLEVNSILHIVLSWVNCY